LRFGDANDVNNASAAVASLAFYMLRNGPRNLIL
jgi:hypothetical protein